MSGILKRNKTLVVVLVVIESFIVFLFSLLIYYGGFAHSIGKAILYTMSTIYIILGFPAVFAFLIILLELDSIERFGKTHHLDTVGKMRVLEENRQRESTITICFVLIATTILSFLFAIGT